VIISAMAVISPYGLGAGVFGEGIRAGRSALSPVDPADEVPYKEAGLVDGDAMSGVLVDDCEITPRAQRIMGRPAGLAVSTLALLLREHGLTEYGPAQRAVVLGGDLTTTDRAMDLMYDSLTEALPYFVNAKQLPSTAMNFPTTQCAVRFGFQGPNSTITSGRVTGLSVLNYARRLHLAGRAPMVVAGAVEDLNRRRSWITWHGLGGREARPLGEGCCVFLTESAASAAEHGRTPIAEVLALEFGSAREPADAKSALTTRIRRALVSAGVGPSDVDTAVLSGVDGDDEHEAVLGVLGADTRVLFPQRLIGDTAGASGAFQVATALSDPAAKLAVITAVDPDGQVGCGVLRVLSPTSQGA
jgi:3-oxoacyl-[acyl-carrier-protein] synthase II